MFVVPAENIQNVIILLMPYTYSREYMEEINYNREACENEFSFDCSMAVILLGGSLMCKNDYKGVN